MCYLLWLILNSMATCLVSELELGSLISPLWHASCHKIFSVLNIVSKTPIQWAIPFFWLPVLSGLQRECFHHTLGQTVPLKTTCKAGQHLLIIFKIQIAVLNKLEVPTRAQLVCQPRAAGWLCCLIEPKARDEKLGTKGLSPCREQWKTYVRLRCHLTFRYWLQAFWVQSIPFCSDFLTTV